MLVKAKLVTMGIPVRVNGVPVTAAVASLANVNTPGLTWAVIDISQFAEPALASSGVAGTHAAASASGMGKEKVDITKIEDTIKLRLHLMMQVFKGRYIECNSFLTVFLTVFFSASSVNEAIGRVVVSLKIMDAGSPGETMFRLRRAYSLVWLVRL
jgi:hypothetical protein